MAHILIVDDEEILRDLLSQILERDGHTCDEAASGVEGCRRVASTEYDLIITDVRMPEMGGIEFLRRIESQVEGRTPCMIITALADEPSIAVKAVRLACDFLSKPFEVRTIQAAVERALALREAWRFRHAYEKRLEEKLAEQAEELRQTYQAVLSGFAGFLEGKDEDLDNPEFSHASHCQRLARYTKILALGYGITDQAELHDIELGATLHDIGKFRIPDKILHKPARLTAEEYEIVKRHPEYGYEAIQHVPFLRGAEDIVYCHHERWDGKGYPRGLAGEEIPLSARLFAIADTFDAICENRCYRDKSEPTVALEEIRKCSGTQFDPGCVAVFERVFDELMACRERMHRDGTCGDEESSALETSVATDVASALRREVAAGGNGVGSRR